MSGRLKLGIDLDDTIWKTTEKLIERYNEKFNKNFSSEEMEEVWLHNLFRIPVEEFIIFFREYDGSEISIKELEFVEGLKQNWGYLKQNFELIFITSRGENTADHVSEKLKILGGDPFPVYFVHDENEKKIKEKVNYCEELGVDFLIDDSFEHVSACSEKGIKCFLIDNPWNRKGLLNEKIVRVKDWNDILDRLKEEEK